MGLGANLQYLRRMSNGMTRDQLAERMGVSRQTISKWEAEEAYPEIEKIFRLCDLFRCSMDELMREDMSQRNEAFSLVRIVPVEGFHMARYVMITPQPENDVNTYMRRWAEQSGLLDVPGYELDMIGWDFPHVSQEQQSVYGLRGYVAACVLPEGFTPKCEGAEIAWQESNTYAAITITNPFSAAFDLIPRAYKQILQYLDRNGFKKNGGQGIACFERVYEKQGVCYMDVYIAVDALTKASGVFPFP